MEQFPQPTNSNEESDNDKESVERIELAMELFATGEVFSFSGIGGDSYESLKDAEEGLPPGFVTPIDELLKRFEREGMKIVLGKHPQSGNIFIMPAETSVTDDDIEANSIFPRHLQITDDMDGRLKRLIRVDKNKY